MKRWRLVVMPLIVLAVGLGAWALAPNRQPLEIRPDEPLNPGPSNPVIQAPKSESVEKILETDVVRFLEMSLKKYDDEIHSHACTFDKHERVAGVLRDREKCEVRLKEGPFSVHMRWIDGADKAYAILYVAGQNDGAFLVRPRLWGVKGPIVTKKVDDPDAKKAGRFTIAQAGFRQSTERSLASMKKAQARGALHVKYEGIVAPKELKGTECYKLVRTPYDPYEEDDLNELTLYYDTKYWLQVGAVLKDAKGQLLGEYFFTDVQVNPKFDAKQFTRDAL